ncbi:MAG TPA: hypothetical protein VGU45_07530 [Microvirga sp.]|nr:hypothetical protein [Microvirga sp.]
MFPLLFSALIGGGFTFSYVSGTHGVLLGLAAAPFGGSALALGTALLVAHRQRDLDVDGATTEQVEALRGVLAVAQTEKAAAQKDDVDHRAA